MSFANNLKAAKSEQMTVITKTKVLNKEQIHMDVGGHIVKLNVSADENNAKAEQVKRMILQGLKRG